MKKSDDPVAEIPSAPIEILPGQIEILPEPERTDVLLPGHTDIIPGHEWLSSKYPKEISIDPDGSIVIKIKPPTNGK